MAVFVSKSIKETHGLAEDVLNNLRDRNIICLYGELGAGKTTFVQGLAKLLGIKKRVISPTFIIAREYDINNFQFSIFNFQLLVHLDCYRVQSEKDIKSIDLNEIWADTKNLIVIEWAEKIKKILPKNRIDIKFEYINKNERRISIVY